MVGVAGENLGKIDAVSAVVRQVRSDGCRRALDDAIRVLQQPRSVVIQHRGHDTAGPIWKKNICTKPVQNRSRCVTSIANGDGPRQVNAKVFLIIGVMRVGMIPEQMCVIQEGIVESCFAWSIGCAAEE